MPNVITLVHLILTFKITLDYFIFAIIKNQDVILFLSTKSKIPIFCFFSSLYYFGFIKLIPIKIGKTIEK